MRAIVAVLAVLITGCASEQRPWLHPYYRPTTKVGGLTYCAKHHIPTISIIGYHAIDTRDKMVLVHDWSPEALRCDPDNPNRLADWRKFHRTKIHPVRGVITFCARCSWDYWHCVGGDRQLSASDVQQITSLALRDRSFRKPILHLFAVYSPNAVVVGGREERVGDVFTDIGLEKRDGGWTIAYPVSSHRIVAIGRDP